MALEIDPGVTALFGSGTRVRVLAPLANAFGPLTAYRIAELVQVPRTKVYRELRRLARAGIVREAVSPAGRTVWALNDPDVVRLLRRRVRVGWSEDLKAASTDLEALSRRVIKAYRRTPIDPALLRKASKPRNPDEFDRPRQKDETLRRLGLRPSGR